MSSLGRRHSWLPLGLLAAGVTFLANAYTQALSPRWLLPVAGFVVFALCATATGWWREMAQARAAGLGGFAVGLLSGIALIAIVILSQSGSFQATSTWANYNSTLFPAVIPVALESFFGLLVAATFAEIGASRARHRRKQDRIKARRSAAGVHEG